MSQPEHEAILNEIRGSQLPASSELRERVGRIATSAPPAPPGRDVSWLRRPWFVLPAAAAVAGAAALSIGLATSGGSKPEQQVAAGQLAHREAAPKAQTAFT